MHHREQTLADSPHRAPVLLLVAALLLIPAHAQAGFWARIEVRLNAVDIVSGEDRHGALAGVADHRAFRLSSPDPRFGGLSGAVWLDGRLHVTSDRGTLFRADPVFDDQGLLSDLRNWQAAELRDPEIRHARLDVEALAGGGAQRLTIALEDQRTLRILDLAGSAAEMELSGHVTGFRDLGGNEGIEGLCTSPNGDLLAFSEGETHGDGRAVSRTSGEASALLSYRTANGFAVTGADRLGSTIFVLERRFGILAGWQARVSRFPATSLDADAGPIVPERLVHLHSPVRMDNFEAIAMRKTGDDRPVATLLSDDNFSPLQETLLLDLALADRQSPDRAE